MSPVSSVEALLGAIERSGLLTAEGLATARSLAAKITDPKQLARELVRSGALTRWQATQLLHSYHSLVLGQYALLDQVSASPVARVYLVEHVQMRRKHLLRVLSKRHAANPDIVRRFLDEAQRACSLDHRNISHVYDVNQDGERYYIVMEHVEGADLARLVAEEGPLDLVDAVLLAEQAAQGLAHAHQRGVFHGDLQPANLLLDAAGTLKILSIGQCQLAETDSGAPAAADDWQAPEQRTGAQPIDARTDLYALGRTLVYLLTGKSPPDAAAARAALAAREGVPPAVTDLCAALLAESPADRPASIQAVAEQLAAIASELSASRQAAARAPTDAGDEPIAIRVEPAAQGGKKLPAAKPLSESAALPVARPIDKDAVVVFDPATIQVADKPKPVKKQPPAAGKSKPAAAAKFKPPAPSPLTALRALSPVQIGAIAGAVLLLLGLAGGGYWFLSRPRTTTVAQRPADQMASSAAPSGGAAAEANPPAVEANPDVVVAPAPESQPQAPPAAAPPAAPTGAPSAPAAPAPSPPTTPVAAPQPPAKAEAPASQPKSEPAKAPADAPKTDAAAPAKTEAKPDAQTAAKDAPAKAAPAKAAPPKAPAKPPPGPFQGLAKAVSLPELPDAPDQPASAVLEPVELGPCRVDDKTPLYLRLKGGDSIFRGGKQYFALEPAGTPDQRRWSLAFDTGEAKLAIATFSVARQKLSFQWTDEALKQAASARLATNCAVELKVGPATHVLALRKPILGEPLAVQVERAGQEVRWTIPAMPDVKQVQIELLTCEGVKNQRIEPALPVPAGDSVTVWVGPPERPLNLGLKVNSSATTRGVSVKLEPQIRLQGMARPQLYRKREFATLLQKSGQDLQLLLFNSKQAADAKPKDSNERAQLDVIKKKLSEDLTAKQAVVDQLNGIQETIAALQESGKLHFRVSYPAEDTRVDLLVTTEDPKLLAPPKPAAPTPAAPPAAKAAPPAAPKAASQAGAPVAPPAENAKPAAPPAK